MNDLKVDDIVKLTWESGTKEVGVIEIAASGNREKVVRLEDDYVIPLRLVSEHEIEYVTNDLRDPRVPAWLRSL